MAHFVVTYTYADAPEQLDAIRPEHRAYLSTLVGKGLVGSGPLLDTEPAQALLVFEAADAEAVGEMLEDDPFQLNDLVADTRICGWNPVIGVLS